MAEKEHAVEETTQTNGSAPAVEENKVICDKRASERV